MSFWNFFTAQPYTNLHALNLDWIIDVVKRALSNSEAALGRVDGAAESATAAQAAADEANEAATGAAQSAASAAQTAAEAKAVAEEAKEIATQAAEATIPDGTITKAKLTPAFQSEINSIQTVAQAAGERASSAENVARDAQSAASAAQSTANAANVTANANALKLQGYISKVWSVTIPASAWQLVGDIYQASISVPGVNAAMRIRAAYDGNNLGGASALTVAENWSVIYLVESSTDAVTFEARALPALDLPALLQHIREGVL